MAGIRNKVNVLPVVSASEYIDGFYNLIKAAKIVDNSSCDLNKTKDLVDYRESGFYLKAELANSNAIQVQSTKFAFSRQEPANPSNRGYVNTVSGETLHYILKGNRLYVHDIIHENSKTSEDKIYMINMGNKEMQQINKSTFEDLFEGLSIYPIDWNSIKFQPPAFSNKEWHYFEEATIKGQKLIEEIKKKLENKGMSFGVLLNVASGKEELEDIKNTLQSFGDEIKKQALDSSIPFRQLLCKAVYTWPDKKIPHEVDIRVGVYTALTELYPELHTEAEQPICNEDNKENTNASNREDSIEIRHKKIADKLKQHAKEEGIPFQTLLFREFINKTGKVVKITDPSRFIVGDEKSLEFYLNGKKYGLPDNLVFGTTGKADTWKRITVYVAGLKSPGSAFDETLACGRDKGFYVTLFNGQEQEILVEKIVKYHKDLGYKVTSVEFWDGIKYGIK